MADNVPITPGSGIIIGADEVIRNAITEKHQIVKIGLGGESTFTNFLSQGQTSVGSALSVVLVSDAPLPSGTNFLGFVSGNVTTPLGSETFNHVRSGTAWIAEPEFRKVIISGIQPINGSVIVSNVYPGSEAWIVGSVNVTNLWEGSTVWMPAGSVNIDNAVSVGSLATQGIIGSVAVTNLGSESYIPAGSVSVTNIYTGSNAFVTPSEAGGLSIYRNVALGSASQSVKGTAGQLYGYFIYNSDGVMHALKVFNVSGAAVSGTDTPVLTIPIPAEGGANMEFTNGITFSSGISVIATGSIADTDWTDVGSVTVNIFYK